MKAFATTWFITLLAVPALATPEYHDDPTGAYIQKTVLSECFIDSEFDSNHIREAHSFGGNGFKWISAKYRHSYLLKKKILIVGVSAAGQVYEREVESREPKLQDFSRTASYHEIGYANNFATQKSRVAADVNDFLRARAPFQCE